MTHTPAIEFPYCAYAPYLENDYGFRVAIPGTDLAGFWRLRTAVFCNEQKIFAGSDRDQHDAAMIPLVCISKLMGMDDRIVGAVRIEER